MSVWSSNRYQPGLPPPRPQSREDSWPWCHLHNGAPRPSSWELGDGKGGNGLAPGVKWPVPEPPIISRKQQLARERLAAKVARRRPRWAR